MCAGDGCFGKPVNGIALSCTHTLRPCSNRRCVACSALLAQTQAAAAATLSLRAHAATVLDRLASKPLRRSKSPMAVQSPAEVAGLLLNALETPKALEGTRGSPQLLLEGVKGSVQVLPLREQAGAQAVGWVRRRQRSCSPRPGQRDMVTQANRAAASVGAMGAGVLHGQGSAAMPAARTAVRPASHS